jgi:sec-independent protein translocase protein TatC
MSKRLKTLWRVLTAPVRLIAWIVRMAAGQVKAVYLYLHHFLTFEPEESDLPETVQKAVQRPLELLPHLDALRKHLFRAVLFYIITTGFSFIYAAQILAFLARPLSGGVTSLQVIEVTEPISVFMRLSLLSGFALALPYIVFELVLFIGEGLMRRTRLFLVLVVIPVSTLLFIGGMAFAYFVMLPVALPFLLNILNFETKVRASSYVRFVSGVMFWIGVVFEFPMVIYIIARLGWVKAQTLAKQWRLAIIVISVLAAAITPTIDPVNMSIVMIPLIVLYFLSVGLAFLAQRNRAPSGQV